MLKKTKIIMKPFFLLLFFSSFNINLVAQKIYSKKGLTGRGDIVLVGNQIKLQKEVFRQFKKMQKAALKRGIKIQIVSGYRSYHRQLQLWNKKYDKFTSEGFTPKQTVNKIIEYTTIPGTSRHHWGTDIDIIDANFKIPSKLLNRANYAKNGLYDQLNIWMQKNAQHFGFYLVYDNNLNRNGFKYEPWHYSYKKLAKPMLQQFLKLNILQDVRNNKINGNLFFMWGF
jgi:LAS superfamily LD-carboxypeptidase LdcB